jgi:hypothetical protein
VCADDDLMRAEFDAIIADAWPRVRRHAGPPTPRRRADWPTGRAPAARDECRLSARARQRSPPQQSPSQPWLGTGRGFAWRQFVMSR